MVQDSHNAVGDPECCERLGMRRETCNAPVGRRVLPWTLATQASPRSSAGNVIVLNASWRATLDAQPTSRCPGEGSATCLKASRPVAVLVAQLTPSQPDETRTRSGEGDSVCCGRLGVMRETWNDAGGLECCETADSRPAEEVKSPSHIQAAACEGASPAEPSSLPHHHHHFSPFHPSRTRNQSKIPHPQHHPQSLRRPPLSCGSSWRAG